MEDSTTREKNVPSRLISIPSSIHSPSHQTTPTPRRNERTSWPRHRRLFPTSDHLLLILILILSCLSLTSAKASQLQSQYIEESMVDVPVQAAPSRSEADLLKSQLDRLAKTGTILVDPRPPPNPKSWILGTEHDDLQRRSFADLSSFDNPHNIKNVDRRAAHSSSSSATTMITTATLPSSTVKASKTSSGIAVATNEAASPLPSPFDQGFAGNITDSCNSFMYGFLTNATFKACLPFSLLLQGSTSFFTASKSTFQITQTLDATCSANVTSCSTLMSSLASNLTASANCASDLSNQNPLIQQARLGLLAYEPLYTASCLRNPSTSSYCFADAVTNASSPTDSYIYYLPLNISLPGGSQPTCNACLKNTMAVFERETQDRTSALTSDYVNAATQINLQCGPGFVNQSLAAPMTGAASTMYPFTSTQGGLGSNVGVVALAMLVGSWLL